MAIQFVLGPAGSGKTEYVIKKLIEESMAHGDLNYLYVVPEQFSMEAQRDIVTMHPRHGTMNIDAIGFNRLAYRVFDELSVNPGRVLEDFGKSMLIKKILMESQDELLVYGRYINKMGFIDEMKSMMSELFQYAVDRDSIDAVMDKLDKDSLVYRKMHDIRLIYERFEEYNRDGSYIVAEQLIELLAECVDRSDMLAHSHLYLDGFTGFTPVQISFLRELLKVAAQINVTVTIPEFIPGQKGMSEDLFNASKKTADALLMLCKENMQEVEEIVNLREKIAPRFINNPEATFLEQHLFQNNKESYDDFPERIHMTVCRNPDGEADYVMHKIEQLVRQKGYRYRDFAVLSGDVAEYASAFKRKAAILNIPVFEDTKKKVSYHSGVEAVRSLFHLAQMDYS